MKKKRVNRNTKQKNKTKRKNTRRMDNRRGNTKRNIKKRKTRRMDNRWGNTKRNTKRRQRGGMFLPPLPVVAAFNALTGRNAGDYGNPEAATPATPATPATAPAPITFYLNNFFTITPIEGESQGRYKYKLKGNSLQVIHSHGSVLPTYTVVPKGITLYFLVGAGEKSRCYHARDSSRLAETKYCDNKYIRAYQSGSLIQEHSLNFTPFSEFNYDPDKGIHLPVKIRRATTETLTYAPVGLLDYKLNDGDRYFKSEFECEGVKCYSEAMDYLVRILIANAYQLKLNTVNEWYRGLSSNERIEIGYRIGEPDNFKILKSYVEKHLDIFYKDNLDQIYEKEELFFHSKPPGILTWGDPCERLSAVLNKIAEVMKTDTSISGDWFCTFCRYGEPLNIDTLLACQEKYFEPLPHDFFNEKIHFKGAILRHESSLASKSETANFKQTVDALQEYCQGLDTEEEIPGLLSWWRLTRVITATQEVKDKLNDIHTRLHNGEPVSLLPHEVCFIFQLKNHLQKQGLM
jgi:hypothetical protein